MNIKNFLVPLALALITTWAIQYFIFNRFGSTDQNAEVKSGQTFVAPQSKLETAPLNRNIDFIDSDLSDSASAVQTRIETDHAIYQFSEKGASLEQLVFKRVMNGQVVSVPTLEIGPDQQNDQRCFLVALEQKTPLAYTLIEQKQLENATQLAYSAQTDQAIIQKTFIVYQSKLQIDLALTITPKKDFVQARIIYGAPYMADVKDDIINAIYNSEKGTILKESRTKLDLNKGWFSPTFFGSENRYFVHAMVADPQKFTQRAYYSIGAQAGLIAVLESTPIAQPTTWTVSFYFGPKEDAAMNLVDSRLEQTLDYSGLLAPLSRVLLLLLKYLYSFLHNYGLAIIIMTFLINLLLLPLNIRSARSMKKMTEYQKKLAYIQSRYKDDPEALARERSELINKHGMPGLGGCLPKLLQLPIFFALSRVLSSSIELYKAPFALWIHDLSAKDPSYILPLLIMISMMFVSTATDPKQRFMVIGMALIFGAVATTFSAGLCLYILIGIVLTGIQTLVQKKMNWA